MEKEQILNEIVSTQSLPDYEAVNALWAAMTKAVNVMQGEGERDLDRQRMLSLVERFSEVEIERLLKEGSVGSLIFLDPPLETVLAGPDEESVEDSTMRIIGKVRSSRDSDPREALINLVEILRRIHGNYVHSSKTGLAPPDKDILSSTRKILYLFCILTASKFN